MRFILGTAGMYINSYIVCLTYVGIMCNAWTWNAAYNSEHTNTFRIGTETEIHENFVDLNLYFNSWLQHIHVPLGYVSICLNPEWVETYYYICIMHPQPKPSIRHTVGCCIGTYYSVVFTFQHEEKWQNVKLQKNGKNVYLYLHLQVGG